MHVMIVNLLYPLAINPTLNLQRYLKVSGSILFGCCGIPIELTLSSLGHTDLFPFEESSMYTKYRWYIP